MTDLQEHPDLPGWFSFGSPYCLLCPKEGPCDSQIHEAYWKTEKNYQETQVTDRHDFECNQERDSPHKTNSHIDCRICRKQELIDVTGSCVIRLIDEMEEPPTFLEELTDLINRYSKENDSNTPDFLLAGYLNACLILWNEYTRKREDWYGKHLEIGMDIGT